jgi:hypothetical protein
VNFILLALGILPALMALLSVTILLRVVSGNVNFTSNSAMWSHILTVVAGVPLAAWLFSLAFA